MTIQDRYAAAYAIKDPVKRSIAQAILEQERYVENYTAKINHVREQIVYRAAFPNSASYADSIEGLIHTWRAAYTRLEQAESTLQLLNQVQNTQHDDNP